MKALLPLLLMLSAPAWARVKVVIDHDKKDCIEGWVVMDVAVKVDEEEFKFEPSCAYSFNRIFQTKAGVECRIQAGMCSSFFPQHAIEVRCSDGVVQSVDVACSKRKSTN